ncbi:MAG: helix-turn-helix domain-containing protein [Pseudonocardiales bacterium]|nr:helix-turn-helix domain-containing protein [Pseudonocardiales bacterium]MBV9032000.1 helix-turn-helix domain-containing protein [Pseudonocardiales bacterium]MBW0008940.1 helix-turn-helix domain-containing protein [Pseudonocardiales bacterium]
MTVDTGEPAAERVRLRTLRRSLGLHLAIYRTAAGVSQPELAQALSRTRSTISKVEHGTRGMPQKQWRITDEVCRAEGALVSEHSVLAQAEQDYRGRWRAQQRQARQAAAQAGADALRAAPAPAPVREREQGSGRDAWPETTGAGRELAEELMREVVTTLARSLGRREALRVARWALAAVGLSGLDADECARVAQALEAPRRVDAHVVNNLATTLAHCKRQEDTLGPCEVLDTVVAQHGIVRHLLKGDCPEGLRRSLNTVDSNMATTIGGYLISMGQPDGARRYFERARRAGHDARNPACAAYAAAWTTYAAFLRGDTCAALDTAAAARSLAARTDDAQLKAFVELMAAGAYALDGRHGPYMAACDRASGFLAGGNKCAAGSPAYWIHEGTLDSHRSKFLSLLGKPRQAVEAATNALARLDHTPYVHDYAHCEVKLGNGLVLSEEIPEAARVLGDAARLASLSPRLTAELHATRALMRPWDGTQAVTTLDAQLEACGLIPTTAPYRRPGSSGPSS